MKPERVLPFLGILFCLLYLSACTQTPFTNLKQEQRSADTSDFLTYSLEHDGIEREYLVYLPTAYEQKRTLPLVLALHGYAGTASGLALETSAGLNNYAEKYNFIVVYPQASHFIARDAQQNPSFVSS